MGSNWDVNGACNEKRRLRDKSVNWAMLLVMAELGPTGDSFPKALVR